MEKECDENVELTLNSSIKLESSRSSRIFNLVMISLQMTFLVWRGNLKLELAFFTPPTRKRCYNKWG